MDKKFRPAYLRFRTIDSGENVQVHRAVRSACHACALFENQKNTICDDCPMTAFVRAYERK